jgi:hypothetical protein
MTDNTLGVAARENLYRMVNGAINAGSFGEAREMIESGDIDDLIAEAGHEGDSAGEIIQAATGFSL